MGVDRRPGEHFGGFRVKSWCIGPGLEMGRGVGNRMKVA